MECGAAPGGEQCEGGVGQRAGDGDADQGDDAEGPELPKRRALPEFEIEGIIEAKIYQQAAGRGDCSGAPIGKAREKPSAVKLPARQQIGERGQASKEQEDGQLFRAGGDAPAALSEAHWAVPSRNR